MRFSTTPSFSWFFRTTPSVDFSFKPEGDLNTNIEITVYPRWYDQITLEWVVPPAWVNAQFNVYFKESGSDSFVRLNKTLLSNPYFSDKSTREYSKTQEGHYVVEAILSSGIILRSLPVTWEYKRREKVDKIANEIQRREYLLLSKFVGAKSFFFRKKNYGTRCTRCWDAITEKVMDDNCPVCYGTSWVGGYWDPIPLFLQWDTTKVDKQKSYQGTIEPLAIGAWTISFPQITSEDVIIRSGTWSTYKVLSSNPTELQTKPVRQILVMSYLSKSDVENKLVERIQSTDSSEYLTEYETRFLNSRFPQRLLDTNLENDHSWAKKQHLTTLPMYKL